MFDPINYQADIQIIFPTRKLNTILTMSHDWVKTVDFLN